MTNFNRRMYIQADETYIDRLRVFYSKKKQRYLIKCGCCDEKIEILSYATVHNSDDDVWLEINGVLTSWREWKRVISIIVKEEVRRAAGHSDG